MRIYMQRPALDGKPPRFVQIIMQQDLIEGWTLIIEQGQQGRAGRTQRSYFEDFDDAQEAMSQARDKQLKLGYRVVFAEGMQA